MNAWLILLIVAGAFVFEVAMAIVIGKAMAWGKRDFDSPLPPGVDGVILMPVEGADGPEVQAAYLEIKEHTERAVPERRRKHEWWRHVA